MGQTHSRFVAKSEAGQGWRIWDNTGRRWWGQAYRDHPEALLAERNSPKRPERLTELAKQNPRSGA